MKIKLLASLLLAAGVCSLPTAALAATAADLANCCTAGDKDFPKVGGNLGNQNYSALNKITRSNIRNLGGAWVNRVTGGASAGSQNTPVVVDGVIYLEIGGRVIAVDGKTGVTKWSVSKAANTRRGVAVAKDLGIVYTLGSGNSLVALAVADGSELWRKSYTADDVGGVAKVALVYHNRRLFIGTNDGNYGAGLMVDANNGTLLSKFYGVPRNPGDLGFDTWGGAAMSERTGGTAWIHPAVDPELNLVYWTFGNTRGGSSQNGSTRPGQNLFANSIVALDATSGEYKWHFQSVHHDVWDMDNVMAPVLVDAKIGGVDRKLVVYGSKTGMYYILDRRDGSAPLGIDEVPVPVDPRQASYPTQPRPRQGGFVDTCAIWEPLGGPVPGHPSRAVPNYPRGCLYAPHWDGAPVLSFPGHGGGANWSHISYSPITKLVYNGVGYVGASHSLNEGSNGLRPPGEYMTGAVVAVDPSTNLVRWRQALPYSVAHGNGILSTAGNVLFIGQPDGNVIGMDATNGRELWRFQTGSSINASPISYEIDGEQYVAVFAAGTGIPYGTGGVNGVQTGDYLWAFKVGGTVPQAATPQAPSVRRPVAGNAVTGASVNNTVLLGRSSATAAEQSINSGSTNGMYPTWMTINVGTSVTFTNPADSVHTHCATQFFEGAFNFSLAPGQSATYTFTRPGEYFYNDCHNPRSTGKIVVSP